MCDFNGIIMLWLRIRSEVCSSVSVCVVCRLLQLLNENIFLVGLRLVDLCNASFLLVLLTWKAVADSSDSCIAKSVYVLSYFTMFVT